MPTAAEVRFVRGQRMARIGSNCSRDMMVDVVADVVIDVDVDVADAEAVEREGEEGRKQATGVRKCEHSTFLKGPRATGLIRI